MAWREFGSRSRSRRATAPARRHRCLPSRQVRASQLRAAMARVTPTSEHPDRDAYVHGEKRSRFFSAEADSALMAGRSVVHARAQRAGWRLRCQIRDAMRFAARRHWGGGRGPDPRLRADHGSVRGDDRRWCLSGEQRA